MKKNSNKKNIKEAVRNIYGQVASDQMKINLREDNGQPYSKCAGEQVDFFFEETCMGIGCGNPFEAAGIQPGEIVVDLGCGGGFDVFHAAGLVGEKGRVIGIDMTPEMIRKAKENLEKFEFTNVEFQLGDIEKLCLPDNSADVVISNCVINLAPDKKQVFREIYRVLVPGGRIAIADIVSIQPLPEEFKKDVASIAECLGGAASVDEIVHMIHASGFINYKITINEESRQLVQSWMPGGELEKYIRSALIVAEKPFG